MSDTERTAQLTIDQWDNHDRFRDFNNIGEPCEVRLARAHLSLIDQNAKLLAACKSTLEALRSAPLIQGDYWLDVHAMSTIGKQLRAAIAHATPGGTNDE